VKIIALMLYVVLGEREQKLTRLTAWVCPNSAFGDENHAHGTMQYYYTDMNLYVEKYKIYSRSD